MVAVNIDGTYALVVLQAIMITMECAFMAIPVGGIRKKYFTKEFFAKNFPELKGREDSFRGGYPDCGGGKFSNKLPTEQWLDFQFAQRGHLNFVEGLCGILLALLVCGLFQPKLTLILGTTYMVGRFLYAMAYGNTLGPKGRIFGFTMLTLSMYTLQLTSLYSLFRAAGGLDGILAVVAEVAQLKIIV